MDITRAIILKSNINDDLWPELVFAIIYIKNSQPMQTLKNISFHETHFHKQPNLAHLQILSSTIYILLYKKKYLMKSEKWATQVLKRILVGYNRYIIYKVHIRK